MSFSAGVATPSITLTKAATGLTLTATQGVGHRLSATFTVSPGNPASFTVPTPAPQTAGTSFTVGITALDGYGNTATGYSGSQTLTWSGTAAASSPNNTAPTLPNPVTFTCGAATASGIVLTKAQSGAVLTVSQGAASGSTGPFNVANKNALSSFSVANPGTQTAGTSFQVGLTALDQYGNTDYQLHRRPSADLERHGHGQLAQQHGPDLARLVSFSAGAATPSVTLTKAQNGAVLTVAQGTPSGSTTGFTVSNAATMAGVGLTNVAQPTPSLTCTGAVGNVACASTGEGNLNGNGNAGARTVTANVQLQDSYGNAWNNTGSSVAITVTRTSGFGTGTLTTSGSMVVANGSTTTPGTFTFVRSAGSGVTATMSVSIAGSTTLTVTLSS